jgi:hypothetical protein
MKRITDSVFWILFIISGLLAGASALTLMQDFSGKATYIDLGVLFIQGLIAGYALRNLLPFTRRSS